ncbi:unnamed protein product [Urochloa humidicola]
MPKNYGGLYNVLGWGDPYFVVNTEGHLSVKPHGVKTMPGKEIDIHSVILQALEKTPSSGGKTQFPMILRFPDVLKNRLEMLHKGFNDAIADTGYENSYQGVFPIKVNHNKAIVQDMVAFGVENNWKYGLEAGSKPELLIAISCLTKADNTDPDISKRPYLVCNGYKDADYIALALSARAMGLNVIVVLEMEEELQIVSDEYAKLKEKLGEKAVEPAIGVRAKLLTKIPGHFGSTAGKHGKFGLLAEQIYDVAKKLRDDQDKSLSWLKVLHFHIGSMIPNTDIVSKAVREASGIYCELVNTWGAPMMMLDCGGGLGIDYDGTRSGNSDMSVAYGIQEYASSVVQAARVTCAYQDPPVPVPILCTESGRAMASHHSMIILEALSAIQEPQDDEDTSETLLSKIRDLHSKHPGASPAAMSNGSASGAIYSHAAELKKHGIEMYKLGKKLGKRVVGDDDTIYNYHMNLSIFSLVPDFWGIGQLFPMMPVTRLNEEPTLKGTLVDITCDSDGKIEKFIGGGETLPLHKLEPGQGGYYVAVLVSGAYQEALSGKHNLFSGPTIVRVVADAENQGGFDIVSVDLGPTAEEIIPTMRYNVEEDITNAIKELATEKGVWEEAVKQLVTKGLTTMPYLNEYKAPVTIVP